MFKSNCVLFLLLLSCVQANADCFTGFACSIEELEKQSVQEQKYAIYYINNYFDRKKRYIKRENNYLTLENYNDLFIFSIIL